MIVVTLTANAPKGPVILTECGNTHLHNGDKIHCEPDLANALALRHPDNLVKSPYWDKPTMPVGQKWELEKPTVAGASAVDTTPTGIQAADRSMGSSRNKQRTGARGKDAVLGG